MLKGRTAQSDLMTKEKSKSEGIFADYEIVHDSIGVTHFLPPRRCKNCDD